MPRPPGEPFHARSEDDTVAAGRALAARLGPGAIVRLHGELGAGKTCFTRGLAEALGVDPAAVHSPTFSLVHLYRDGGGRPALYHIDLYRLEGEEDLREIGLEEVFASGVPAAVEWAERLGARFPAAPGDWQVSISTADHERRITIRRGG